MKPYRDIDRVEELSGGLLRVLTFSTIFGAVFGVIAALSYYLLANPFQDNWFFFIVIPLCSASISGAAGIAGYYLDVLLRRCGISSKGWRQLTTFLILAAVTQGGAIWFGIRFGGQVVWQRQYLWGGFIGCFVGAVLAIVEYRFSMIREKMIALELENKYLAELSAKDRQLREIAEDLAVSEERNRMARELHDSVSQGIHGIVFTVHSLKNCNPDDERVRTLTRHLEETADAVLSELRAMILELKPSLFDERGLIEAIKLHGELFSRRHQIELALSLEPVSGLTPDQEMAVYRIVQEALSNIGRHSEAKHVEISWVNGPLHQAKLTICDDGKGFIPETAVKGNGLANMAVRSREAGGSFQIVSEPGRGTKIEVIIAVG